jgi:hypothetical protein
MKTYLIALAVYTAFSFIQPARAELPSWKDNPAYHQLQRDMEQSQKVYIPQVIEPLDTYGSQRRMNRQYQQQQIQDQLQQQQQQLQYQQHQEHMRNQGWGRPGLDGGY